MRRAKRNGIPNLKQCLSTFFFKVTMPFELIEFFYPQEWIHIKISKQSLQLQGMVSMHYHQAVTSHSMTFNTFYSIACNPHDFV